MTVLINKSKNNICIYIKGHNYYILRRNINSTLVIYLVYCTFYSIYPPHIYDIFPMFLLNQQGGPYRSSSYSLLEVSQRETARENPRNAKLVPQIYKCDQQSLDECER